MIFCRMDELSWSYDFFYIKMNFNISSDKFWFNLYFVSIPTKGFISLGLVEAIQPHLHALCNSPYG